VKVGAENRTKLVLAVVSAAVAIALMGWRFSGIFGGASANETTSASTHMPTAAELSNQPARPVTRGTQRTRTGAASSTGGKKQSAVASLDPTLHFDLLKGSEDTKYGGTGRNIFRVFVEPPPPPIVPVVAPGPKTPTPPQITPPPPSNLRFYGFATSRPDGAKRIFLTKNEDVFIAAEGDIVDRRYKVVRISPNSVEILDVLSNNRESIPLSAG